MIDASTFVSEFADYLGNPKRLPFVAPPYKVIPPEFSPLLQRNINEGHEVEFKFHIGDDILGHLKVCPNYIVDDVKESRERTSSIFLINGVNSGYAAPYQDAKQGWGREFVRRAVLYASDHNYTQIRTSVFIRGAASFWLGLGFRDAFSDGKPPIWKNAGDLDSEVPKWQKELEASPDAIWRMARTEFGRRVLNRHPNCGVLDLKDPIQRAYSFERLKLS